MRTQEQIVEKIKNLKNDFFGVAFQDLAGYLDFEHAKEFLKEGVTADKWEQKENTAEAIKKEMAEYLPFAWGKANDCRGLSANRSIEHMRAWLWLLADDELQKRFDDTEYEHYGKEKLIVISEAVGFDWKKEDDGIRTNY